MKRRDFITTAAATTVCGTLPATAAAQSTKADSTAQDSTPAVLHEKISGMTLCELRQDYQQRLYKRYLPFWDKGGYDREHSGVMCEFNDDGSVAVDMKYIWYQGRAIWVYSYLYNNFGEDPRWLAMAANIRNFMIEHMHIGGGRWNQEVRRDGTLISGAGKNIYGALFAAVGLVQYARASGREEDLDLAELSIQASIDAYDSPDYMAGCGVGDASIKVDVDDLRGLRQHGHSMVIVWTLTQLLAFRDNPALAQLQAHHVEALINRFWNPEFGIQNEILAHDYSRLPQTAAHMYAGHSLESLWMVMHEALRIEDRALFDTAKDRIRRLLEMCWDYVFDGWADTDYYVFDDDNHQRGPSYDVKTMWAHCEILIACMTVMEYSGEDWAKMWYRRARAYLMENMAGTQCGIWRLAVDRRGKDVKREAISIYRKGNFHQPRVLMMDSLSLDRMIANQGRLTPFPGTT